MRKAIYIFAICAMFSFTIAPAIALEVETTELPPCGDGMCVEPPHQDPVNIGTGFDPSVGGGNAPIIKAKWEMLPRELWNDTCDDCDVVTGVATKADDSCRPGAQFWPTGEWDTYKEIEVCAIATDPEGVADIAAVYADIFYPEGVRLGPGHVDYGCGEQHGYEIELQEMTLEEGYDLFCNDIRKYNYNLPSFNSTYDFEEICAEDGELLKQTAKVYCKYTHLKWEDPAGDYKVMVHAIDKFDVRSDPFFNRFTYLPLTAFETDFTQVQYGSVKLNTHKIVNGDLTWGNGIPSVRNVGNTRLAMTVWQDDMGLGQTTNGDTWWNVQWDARVGSDATFRVYQPFEEGVVLRRALELSEMNEMDFSILVKKIPLGFECFEGQMILGAIRVEPLTCDIAPK